jgi:hypothetical protein
MISAVVIGATLVVTACSPVQAGSAAIAGNERITVATLDTEVANLSQAVARYKSTVQLSQAQQTQQTLGAGSCCAGWCSWPWTPRRSGRSGYRR